MREADIAIDDKLALHVIDSSDINGRIKQLFESNPDMTALFLLGEIFHRQTFEYIKTSGRRIPEDISMAVFDKVIFDDFKGKIASIEQPVDRMTEELFALISKLLAGEKIENGVVIEPVIFTGESIMRIQH